MVSAPINSSTCMQLWLSLPFPKFIHWSIQNQSGSDSDIDTARGRVREGNVPPPAWSMKLKLPPFYKVNGKLKRASIATL